MTRRTSRGVSLVESLVALLVLSIGMLGIAVLFVQSVRNSRTALLRTQAINLVADMGDRIRANATARGAYDTGLYGGAPAIQNCAPSTTEVGGNCTAAALAEDDLARWLETAQTVLPTFDGFAPAATVAYVAPVIAGGPERFTVRVAWREPGEESGSGEVPELSYQTDVVIIPRQPQS